MVEYILGNYMISKELMSREQLDRVCEKQDKIRVKLGLIAVSEGYMSAGQAEEVNREQAVCDKRFGDIAIEKGYITPAQLDRILKLQGNTYLIFVQALVDEGIVSIEGMEGVLERFRKENGYGNSEMEVLKSDDVDKILPLFLPAKAEEVEEVIHIAVKTILRCIDRHVYPERAFFVDKLSTENMVMQTLEGDLTMTTAFQEDSGAMVLLAGAYARDEFTVLDEEALDSAAEFLNCINGMYTAALESKSVSTDLIPPEYGSAEWEINEGMICKMPLWIRNKKMYFVVIK